MLALQPGGLHALLLYRAPLPHVLGTDGALWVVMEISAPQGVPVLPNCPYRTGAGEGLEGILAALGLSLCRLSKEEVLGLPVPLGTAFFRPVNRNDAQDGR